jgi:hypothetical protein
VAVAASAVALVCGFCAFQKPSMLDLFGWLKLLAMAMSHGPWLPAVGGVIIAGEWCMLSTVG